MKLKLNKLRTLSKDIIASILGVSLTLVTMAILVLLGLLSCKEGREMEPDSSLPYFSSANFTPQWNTPIHKIPEFSFTNQNGEIVTNATYSGKIYVADFFFTSCPGICPKLTKNMITLQEFYKEDMDIKLLSHTVMPWKDSVPILKDYALKNNVLDVKWNLVTGNKDELYKIARTGYFADEDFVKTQEESNFIHTENFVLVDKKGYIRGVYNGTLPFDVERLKRHITILKKET